MVHCSIHAPGELSREKETTDFLQRMLNRLIVGEIRYGKPNRKKKYRSKLEKELEHYKKSGNGEQLLNIANYALLEFLEPSTRKFHFDIYAKSIIRK